MPTLSIVVQLEAGTTWHKRFGVWLPDGLHIWVNRRGVHLHWASGGRRVSFDRLPEGC